MIFDTHRVSLVLGVETLHLQGIHYSHGHSRLSKYSDVCLTHLAGNAFHAWCCGGTLLATLFLLAELHTAQKPPESLIQEQPHAGTNSARPFKRGFSALEDLDAIWGVHPGGD